MINFLLEATGIIPCERIRYVLLLFAAAWVLWISRFFASRFYKPYSATYGGSASVVIPVVDEPPAVFREVLRRVCANCPHELIVVINGPDNPALAAVCAEFPLVTCLRVPVAGKRNSIRVGAERSSGEIIVIADSDTLWEPNTLAELLKPFSDGTVGGATTRQRIWRPERSIWTRFADWLEEYRFAYSVPASSAMGQVGCLPGRTIAFRRSILMDAMPKFISERFLGTHLEVSDDRAMTNYTLLAGYKTVYQRSSVVHTDSPTRPEMFVRQQYRWARGSQYNTLKMLPWMASNGWFLAYVSVSDILLPFLLAAVYANFAQRTAHERDLASAAALAGCYAGLATLGGSLSLLLKQPLRVLRNPSEGLLLPVYWLLMSFVLAPIRIWGFVRMAHDDSWGTRAHGYAGSEAASALRWIPVALALLMLAFFVMLGRAFEPY